MGGNKIIKNYKTIISEEIKQLIINDYVENLFSIRDISKKYNIKSKTFIEKVLGDKKRTPSESRITAHKAKPNSFKHTDKAKHKIREARLKYMKEHPEKTAWRQKNLSYPEKCFIEILKEYDFNKKYLIYREYSVFPYFIDFAFVDFMVAVEIDGSQHLNPERAEKDKKKDKVLLEQGWSVIRFTASDVTQNKSMVAEVLKKRLKNNTSCSIERVGVLKAPKTRQAIPREENGRTKSQNECAYNQRKVKERPSKEKLNKLIHEKSFVQIGKMYNVSDNAIRKWCKQYQLEYRKRKLKSM